MDNACKKFQSYILLLKEDASILSLSYSMQNIKEFTMKSVKLYHSLNFCFDSEIIGSYGMSEEKLRSEVKKKIQNLLTNPEMCFSDHALNGFGLTAVVEPSRAFALDIDSFMENGVRKIPEYLCDEDGTCPYEVNLSSPDFDFYSWAKNDAPNLRGRRNDRPNYYTEVFAKVVQITEVWYHGNYPHYKEIAESISKDLDLPMVELEIRQPIWER